MTERTCYQSCLGECEYCCDNCELENLSFCCNAQLSNGICTECGEHSESTCDHCDGSGNIV